MKPFICHLLHKPKNIFLKKSARFFACSKDELPSRFLREFSYSSKFYQNQSMIVQSFINLGSFPDSCKIVKLTTLFKKGSKIDSYKYTLIFTFNVQNYQKSCPQKKQAVFQLTKACYTSITQDFKNLMQQMIMYNKNSSGPKTDPLGPLLCLLYINHLNHAIDDYIFRF